MASLYKKRGLWYVDYYIEGKHFSKNTYLKATRTNIKKAEKIKQEIEDLISSNNYIVSKRISVSSLTEKFKSEHLNLKSKSHLALFNLALKHFYVIVPPTTEIEEVNSSHTAEYIKYLTTRVRNSTLLTYVSYMKIFFNFLVKEEIILKSPFKRNQMPVRERLTITSFNEEILQRILSEAKVRDITFYNILMLLLLSGQRPVDILKLRAGDFDFEEKYILVNIQKTKIQIKFPIHNRLMSFLNDNLPYISDMEEDELIFKNYNTNVVGKKFRRIKIKLGIKEKHLYTLKTFRKTFATHLAMNGIDRTKVADLLGHTDVKITRKYYASISTDNLRKDLNRIFDGKNSVKITDKITDTD